MLNNSGYRKQINPALLIRARNNTDNIMCQQYGHLLAKSTTYCKVYDNQLRKQLRLVHAH